MHFPNLLIAIFACDNMSLPYYFVICTFLFLCLNPCCIHCKQFSIHLLHPSLFYIFPFIFCLFEQSNSFIQFTESGLFDFENKIDFHSIVFKISHFFSAFWLQCINLSFLNKLIPGSEKVKVVFLV